MAASPSSPMVNVTVLSDNRWMALIRPWWEEGPVLAMSEVAKMRTTQSVSGTIWQVRT